jgi:branched-chain amino acid transport system substrate-binding protein
MNKNQKMIGLIAAGMIALGTTGCGANQAQPQEGNANAAPIKIGYIISESGPLSVYAKPTLDAFQEGLKYATDGTMQVDGHPLQVIVKDDATDAVKAKNAAKSLIEDNKVDLLAGVSFSASAIAVEPLAKQYKKVFVVAPAASDAILDAKNFNPYVFKVSRSSYADAAAAVAALDITPGTKIATLAPDYAFGHASVKGFVNLVEQKGATVVDQAFAALNTTDFTSIIQKIISEKPTYLFVAWAGSAGPWKDLANQKIQDHGIKIVTGVPDIKTTNALLAPFVGMRGESDYYYKLPSNSVNTWLVGHMKQDYQETPDLFSADGMATAIAIVDALKKTHGDASGDSLRAAMEGMTFDSPKGTMRFRPEDHQALQSMYAVELIRNGSNYEPKLIRTLSPEEAAGPILNR